MGTNRPKTLLQRTAIQIVAGKELLHETKKRLKKAKDPLAAANIKRELEIVANAVDSIKDHRKLLKQELSSPNSTEGGRDVVA
jgi:Cu2+-containing amine oxidase